MSTEYRYDDDNLGYIVFTVKKTGIQYEYRCIDGKFYLVPLADEMPGERVYVAFETTKTTPSTITIKPKYSDGFPCSQNNSIVKSTDEEMSMSLGHTLGIRNEDLLSSCSVEGVDESYYSVDTEKGLITLSTDVPNGTELNFKIRRQAQVYEDKLLDSAFTSCKVYVSDNIKNVLWETSDGVSSTIQFNCNDYEKFSSEDGVMVPMANFNFDICGQACQKITELTPYIIDEEGNYKNAMPAGCDLVSVNGRLCILLKGMKDNLASTGHNWQFGNQPLTRDVEFWCCYCTADNVVIGEGRGFKTTITVVPYDLPDDIKPRFVDNLLFNADRDNELDFRTPGLYKNIHPEWGTWTAKITPAFEKKDQASLEAEYEWAHKKEGFTDTWWDESYEEEHICTFDTQNEWLCMPEFNLPTSGMYRITLQASPMKEGYPYPFPFKDKTWEFDVAFYPNHTGLELATRTPYSDNWEWSGLSGSTWYGPSDKIPERAEAWKHLSVKPKGGYVDVWYKDISTGTAKKVAPTAGPARAAASPETEGYTKMDGNYIDASNMDRLSLKLSKNGAVNPNTINVNLARLDETQTGVESIDAATAGTAEYYHIDGRRAEGTLAPGLYIKTQDGRSSKVIVR